MARLNWSQAPRNYESGIDRGVFYGQDNLGVPWNGIKAVTETPAESDEVVRYIDGVRRSRRRKPGEFTGTIESFTYPERLTNNLGKWFGLSYRVNTALSYKIHIVYNVLASSKGWDWQQKEVSPFAWDFTTLKVSVPGAKPTAQLIIDVEQAHPGAVSEIEDILYGSESNEPRMIYPEEVLAIFENYALLKVIDHGDGRFTIDGPEEAITVVDATTFTISWPSVVYYDVNKYTIRSL